MNTKITVSMIVGIVVATILTMGILSPVIQDVSTDYESVDNEGSSWIRMVYQTSPVDFDVDFSVDNGTVEISDGAGSQSGSGDTILYADSNMSVWIQDGSVHLLGKTATSTISGTLSDGFSVSGDSEGVTVSDGPDGGLGVYVFPVPTYQFIPAEGGRYGFFPNGTNVLNVPSDLPLVTTGSYAGVDVYNDTNNLGISIYMHDSGDEGYINGVVWDDTEPVASVPEESEPELTPTPVPVGGSEENILYGAGSTPVLRSVPPTPSYTDGDWGYELSGTNAIIISYSGAGGGVITIPSSVGGYPVTELGINPNNNYYTLFPTSTVCTGLVIPEGVTKINQRICTDCVFMNGALTLPSTLTYIDVYAFAGSRFSGSIEITSDMTVRDNAFQDCKFDTVTIDNGATVSGSVFRKCSNLTTVYVDCSNVPNFAFGECTSLTNVTIGDNVTKLGTHVFWNTGLVSIVIPDNVTEIKANCFYKCANLETVTLSRNITTIPNYCFDTCPNLEMPDISNITSIGSYAFDKCTGLTGNLIIPEGVTTIDSKAFYQCTGLTGYLYLPSTLTTLSGEAFANCGNLYGLIVSSDAEPVSTTFSNTGIAEVLNLSTVEYTTTSYGLNADSIQDHIESIGYLGCTSYEETIQKDGALYVVLAILPVVVLAGIAFATLGLIYIRKD